VKGDENAFFAKTLEGGQKENFYTLVVAVKGRRRRKKVEWKHFPFMAKVINKNTEFALHKSFQYP